MKTRIAPTPSGYLHAGNAFNFLVTAQLAKATASGLALRIDDLDAERVRPEYVDDIFRSLEWLGVQVDEGPVGPEDLNAHWSQALRLKRYMELVERLRGLGHLYPCLCSRTRFETVDRIQHTCRTASAADVPAGTPLRLLIPPQCPVDIRDLEGHIATLDLASIMPDPIIQQRDTGRPSYQIGSLSDDLDMGIDLVVRGMDLLPSTACQVYMAGLLGHERFGAVRFHHHALVLDGRGLKLSKSEGALSLKAMREKGVDPAQLHANAVDHAARLIARFRP